MPGPNAPDLNLVGQSNGLRGRGTIRVRSGVPSDGTTSRHFDLPVSYGILLYKLYIIYYIYIYTGPYPGGVQGSAHAPPFLTMHMYQIH